ncbi:hypothetical protein BV372_06850 [Nostoc sp. T09]|uniref:hypothetical protein n=1 Tax=Nostoc sp. T09 TaxID=1932621 RepID=UPI000A3B9BB3|nr:hypothetical protein [Nostoc sp. T09]OUL36568.1 hypothetical protein BV372_06850 [Nostoc sp. T09]
MHIATQRNCKEVVRETGSKAVLQVFRLMPINIQDLTDIYSWAIAPGEIPLSKMCDAMSEPSVESGKFIELYDLYF